MTKDLVSAIQRIEAARADVLNHVGIFEENLRVSRAKLEAFDAALHELNKAVPEDEPAVKAPRLDIAQAVLDRLGDGSAWTLPQLAEDIKRKPSQVMSAIDRIRPRVQQLSDGTYRYIDALRPQPAAAQ